MIEKETLEAQVARAAQEVRETCPVAPSITNTVTINFVANAQIAVGGSAAMVYLPDEGEAMAEMGGAVYINVGTLLPVYADTLPATAKRLHELNKPWVVDPVAVGMGKLRTQLLADFKPYKPTIVRGNASEVITLADVWGLERADAGAAVRGVDSTQEVDAARAAASGVSAHAAYTAHTPPKLQPEPVIWVMKGEPPWLKTTVSPSVTKSVSPETATAPPV